MTVRWPMLYQKAKDGSIRVWLVTVDGSTITVEHGAYAGRTVTQTIECEPKNVGRSNETTAEEQAVREAAAMWEHKRSRKYAESIDATDEQRWLPMLAKDYRKVKNIQFPLDVQIKYDGARAVTHFQEDGTVTLRSRQDKEWVAVDHIRVALRCLRLPPGTRLDGELYAHGESLQQIMSYAKVAQPNTNLLNYHVYDVPVYAGGPNWKWYARREMLHTVGDMIRQAGVGDVIQVAPTWKNVENMDQVMELQHSFIEDGYEGAMLRLHNGEYEPRARSSNLLKVKTFQDAEFKVVDYTMERYTTNGANVELPVWACETSQGKTFDVRPMGTVEERWAMGQRADEYVGQMLTVKFFKYTDGGIPFLPIGKGFRPSEDL